MTTGRWRVDVAVPTDAILVSPDLGHEHRASGDGTPLIHTLHRALSRTDAS